MPKIGQPFRKGSANSGDNSPFDLEGYEEGPDLGLEFNDNYDPSSYDTKRRKEQLDTLLTNDPNAYVDERLSSSVTTGGQNPATIRQFGPVGDVDAVPFETQQTRTLASLESDLDVLKQTAASLNPKDYDLPMGAIETETFERAARQQKVAEKLGRKVKPLEVKATPSEFKDVTVKQYYENQIAALEADIEIEKWRMGESYEQTAREINYDKATQNLGTDAVDRQLALADDALKKQASKGAKSNITNVGGSDISRPRADLSAALNQVSKGFSETGDINKGFLSREAFVNQLKNTPVYGADELKKLNAERTKTGKPALLAESRYEKIVRLGGGPRTGKTQKMINDLFSKSVPKSKTMTGVTNYTPGVKSPDAKILENKPSIGDQVNSLKAGEGDFYYQTTMSKQDIQINPLEDFNGPSYDAQTMDADLPQYFEDSTPKVNQSNLPPIASEGRSRKVFKTKHASGTVVGKGVTKDLPTEVLKQSDQWKAAYGKAIASGMDDVLAAVTATKAVKAAQAALKKTNMLSIPMMTKGSADKFLEQFFPGRRSGGY